jgi:hypothetical protein
MFLILRHSFSFGNAAVLVAGFPVSPLALSTTVEYETTSGAGRNLGNTVASFDCGTVAANPAVEVENLLILLLSHRAGQLVSVVSTAEIRQRRCLRATKLASLLVY